MTFEVAIGHSDIVFPADSGETVLDAAERAGYSLPYSCRKGVCSTCEAGLRAGTVALGSQLIEGPKSAVLLCRAKPQSDIIVHPRRIERREASGTKTIDAWVFRLNWPTEEVATLLLRFPVSIRAKFKAGQYLRIKSPDGSARNFSLANPPQESDGAQLHIRHIEWRAFFGRRSPATEARRPRADRDSVRRFLPAREYGAPDHLPRDRRGFRADQIDRRTSDQARKHAVREILLER